MRAKPSMTVQHLDRNQPFSCGNCVCFRPRVLMLAEGQEPPVEKPGGVMVIVRHGEEPPAMFPRDVGRCHFMPAPVEKTEGEWCMQFKSKE